MRQAALLAEKRAASSLLWAEEHAPSNGLWGSAFRASSFSRLGGPEREGDRKTKGHRMAKREPEVDRPGQSGQRFGISSSRLSTYRYKATLCEQSCGVTLAPAFGPSVARFGRGWRWHPHRRQLRLRQRSLRLLYRRRLPSDGASRCHGLHAVWDHLPVRRRRYELSLPHHERTMDVQRVRSWRARRRGCGRCRRRRGWHELSA